MKILSNEDLKDVEQKTLEESGLTSLDLVERVAQALTREIRRLWNPGIDLVVFAGWGNNGADALATARLLAQAGYEPVVYLFNLRSSGLSSECKVMRDRLMETEGVSFLEITGREPFEWPVLTPDTVLIDGLFGAGLNRALPRSLQILIHHINNSGAQVVAIDIPSGMFAEWNPGSRQDMIHAKYTFAIGLPRMAFFLGDNAEAVGEWKVLDIGYSRSAISKAPFSFTMVDREMVAQFLGPRDKFSSKADYGNAIIFAGKRGMMGAAILSARGALRAGAGKVTVHGPSGGNAIVQTAVPCAMYQDDPNVNHIVQMAYNAAFTSFAVGPGIGTATDTVDALEHFLIATQAAGRQVILDADALNCIAERPNLLNFITQLSVITPHAGEFDRIFTKSDNDEDRLKKAIRASEDHSLIIILKGHHTTIVRPDGKVMFNSSGSPALATPGSGDVLTGILAGLMAAGMKAEIAAFVGPYIHGLAGELAEAHHGEYGVTAEDIALCVGRAI
ncbi:MAG: NAD(P)H-hydrate dehydratase, partial [Muribaculaceae bacterium]|nr:NAD(P)H-hydrate dehydratase [Muribaculaceae bacterium]